MTADIHLQLRAVHHCTLACLHCGSGTPYLPNHAATVEEYAPWLDILEQTPYWNNVSYGGGEPFLHPDLAGLIRGTARGRHTHVVTNGFWLLRKDWLEVARRQLSGVQVLITSRYPVYVQRLGVEEWDKRLAQLSAELGIKLNSFHPVDPATLTFVGNEFHTTPQPFAGDLCHVRFCLDLLPDGMLGKCPFIRALGQVPGMTVQFIEAAWRSMFFDLKTGTQEELAVWAQADYQEACHYCGIATGHVWHEQWSEI